jgi:hypothetical protein
MLVEQDQYSTQEAFDKLQSIIARAEASKLKLDQEERVMEEALKIIKSDHSARSTIDQRD